MIIYSRLNCFHYCIEKGYNPNFVKGDRERASRRMSKLRFDDGWLKRRMILFETFTYPSVLAQTNQDFRWLVLVHPDSPDWVIDEMKKFKRLEVCLVEWDIDAAVRGFKSVNLDTDDALARTFMEEVSKLDFEGETVFFRGTRYRILSNIWLNTGSANSHFNIVCHPVTTVLDFSHGMRILPKDVIDNKRPMWLEVIHEENISNKLRKTKNCKDSGYVRAIENFGIADQEVIEKLSVVGEKV